MKLDGRLPAFGSLLLWSLAAPLTKIGVSTTGYLSFSFWTAVLAVIFSLPLFINENGMAQLRKHWKQIALLSIFAYMLFTIIFFLGMEGLSGVQGSALLGTEIMFSLLVGAALGKEKLNIQNIALALALVIGVAIVVTNGAFTLGAPVATMLLLLAMLLIQVGYYLAPDAMRECGAGALLMPGMVLLALSAVLLSLITGEALNPFPAGGAAMAATAAFALFPVVISYSLFYISIRNIGIYKTTAIVVPAPAPIALIFSVLLLGEVVTSYHLVGMALIVLSAWRITEARQH